MGKLKEMLHFLLRTAHTALQIELAGMGVEAGHVAEIMRDFGNARRHIWLTYCIKFSFWQQLPWMLMGIGSFDENVARP